MATNEERANLKLAKITHLESLIADIDGDLKKVPKLGYLSVLAIPFGIYMGHIIWAVVGAVSVVCLIGVVYYILGVRRDEYAQECTELRREISDAAKTAA